MSVDESELPMNAEIRFVSFDFYTPVAVFRQVRGRFSFSTGDGGVGYHSKRNELRVRCERRAKLKKKLSSWQYHKRSNGPDFQISARHRRSFVPAHRGQ
jgi:hypothetical protein